MQYITLPERDIETAGDTANLHQRIGVFFLLGTEGDGMEISADGSVWATALKNERM